MRKKKLFLISLGLFFFLTCILAADILPKKEKNKMSIILQKPITKGSVSLEETLEKRRSIRSFSNKEITFEQVGQMLWAAQGITEKRLGLRTAPSAGALYPLEVYYIDKKGVFRYVPSNHTLSPHIEGDLRNKLSSAALNQRFIAAAPGTFVICADFQRTARKYGTRAKRYVQIEVGHAAQNILLQATALKLGGVPVGAFSDKYVQNVLELPKNHEPLYIIPIGHPSD